MKSLSLETEKQKGAAMHHLDTCLTTSPNLASLHPASLTLPLSRTHCEGQVKQTACFSINGLLNTVLQNYRREKD